MSNRVLIDQTTNTVNTDQCPEIHNSVVVNNEIPSNIDVIENVTNIITVTVPGPQGPQGPNGAEANISGSNNYIPIFSGSDALVTSSIYQSGSFTAIGATSSLHPNAPETLLVNSLTDSYNLISGHANIDNYVQLNIKNFSGGPSASSDIVATADIGDEESNYINMGINGSNYTAGNAIGGALDAYLYNTGENLYIGNTAQSKQIVFFNGGFDVNANAALFIHDQGTITINTDQYNQTYPPSLAIQAPNSTTNTLIEAVGNTDQFLQLALSNQSSGSLASSDIVAYNNIDPTNQAFGFIDMGINSTNFDDPTNYPGWIGGHSYVFSDAPGMIIGSTSGSSQVNIFAGGVNPITNSKLVIRANNQHSMTGSLSISGSLTNGEGVIASGIFSHAEGLNTTASGSYSHAEGDATQALGPYSHAEGEFTEVIGWWSHAEGTYTEAIGDYAHSEGDSAKAIGDSSHAEGYATIARGNASHAEGYLSITSGSYSHAEGRETTAIGGYSHAEGWGTIASGSYSHAEGRNAIALGNYSHAEGFGALSIGQYSHAEGVGAEARADYSHAEGLWTIASGEYQHVQGQYNISSSAKSAFIIGNGTSNTARRNLVFASGSIFQITGSLQVSGSITGSLFGTASWAQNAVTASYVANASSFPFTGSAIISGSLTVTGSFNVTQGITSSLFGTASWALNAITASYVPASGVVGLNLSQISTGSVTASVNTDISASFRITSGSNTLLNVTKDGFVWIGNGSFANQGYQLEVQGSGLISGFKIGSDGNANESNVHHITKNVGTTIALTNVSPGGSSAIWAGTNATPVSRVMVLGTGDIWMLPSTGVIVGGTTYAGFRHDVQGTGRYTNNLTVTGSIVATQSITASNALITNTITAQTLVVQTITSSTDFVTGSTRFGSLLSNTHEFTGSVSITGSLTLPYLSTGSVLFAGATDNIAEDNTNLFWDNTNKRLGIGTNTPAYKLDVGGTGRFTSGLTVANSFTFTTSNNPVLATSFDNDTLTLRAGNAARLASAIVMQARQVVPGYISFQIGDGSSALVERMNISQSGQFKLNSYTSSIAFTGSAIGYLGFDTSGNILTTNTLTGSLFGTSSWATNAITASYALNGGVTQIIAGTNVTISPASGTGSVTINATGGGGAAFPFTGSALITGSLVITGSTTSTLGFTGSLFGTSSWAQNAATASYATSFYVSGTLNVGKTNIEFQENTNVTSGTWRVVSSEPTASYKAAFFDYVMFSGSIARAGTVYSVWSASYAEYYENYTGDVGGSTAGVSLQAAISGSNIQLQATASNNGWTIRSLVRML
jgi:hypothetical protein